MRKGSKGFTLVEALVAATLLGTGIVAVLSGLSHISATDARNREVERMQRLAVQKYNELVATGATESAALGGDFTDQNETRYRWEGEVSPSSVENLESLSITVKPASGSTTLDATVEGLVYVPPATTDPAAGGATP